MPDLGQRSIVVLTGELTAAAIMVQSSMPILRTMNARVYTRKPTQVTMNRLDFMHSHEQSRTHTSNDRHSD